MKSIMTLIAAAACVFALSACGGGNSSDNSALSRADEGIWSNLDGNEMQAVILNDGSYWNIYGSIFPNNGYTNDGTFSAIYLISHGVASINGNNVSGEYTTFPNGWSNISGFFYSNGTYSGTISIKNNLVLAFNDPQNWISDRSFNMNYDNIYNQPASLGLIIGKYLPGGTMSGFCPYNPCTPVFSSGDPNLTISGSDLTFYDGNGNMAMTGTIASHGAMVNVFDVNLTTVRSNPMLQIGSGTTLGIVASPTAPSQHVSVVVPVGTTFNGILFQTSSGQPKNYIEVIAAAGNNAAFYFLGSKQN
jgi:hypothetical protein